MSDQKRHNDLEIAHPATSLRAFAWLLRREPQPFMQHLRSCLQDG